MTPSDASKRGTGRPRILITGGGTGGHVYPGLAVAESLERLAPGLDVRFVGTRRGLEAALVPRAGFRFTAVPASGVRGLGGRARLAFLLNFGLGFLRSLMLLVLWRPDLVLGTGGYVIGPVMTAARVLGIRCRLQEQNSVPGSANRLVGRWAERIYLGFEAAERWFPAGRCLTTGNPVRAAFVTVAADLTSARNEVPAEWEALGHRGGRVLVFGGSGGAHTLNRAVVEAAQRWAEHADRALVAQTGPREVEEVRAACAAIPADRVRVETYLMDMEAALAWADLVVCRAGAMTLAELQAMGRPAVLVPFPHATDDHQMHNARDCERAGAAVVVADADFDADTFLGVVGELLADPQRLENMAAAARALSRPEAAEVIARELLAGAGVAVADAETGEESIVP